METERILITVRTYPNLSTRYFETVCTGGINDNGEWRRLYPVSLRLLDDSKQYRTFDVIKVLLRDNPDGRPESRRPDTTTIEVMGRVDDWNGRRQWIVPTAVQSMTQMIDQKRTLAPVLVREVLEFIATPEDPEWSAKQKELLRQHGLFEGPDPLEKIPFDFRLRWKDGDGVEHNSKFLAWEVGQAWRNFRDKYPDGVAKVKEKWMSDVFAQDHDIWFFMGNYAGHRQSYGICGTFTPPKEASTSGHLWSDEATA